MLGSSHLGSRGSSMESTFLTTDQLQADLEHVSRSPKESGSLEAIFIRLPESGREAPETVQLTKTGGVQGDRWKASGASAEVQVTLMNVRVLDLVAAGDRDRRSLAGDQLIVDLDLSEDNLPTGQQIQIDDVILQVSEVPHTGCKKFVDRFGTDAGRFVNAPEVAHLNLRGINARIVRSGTVRVGAEVRKV